MPGLYNAVEHSQKQLMLIYKPVLHINARGTQGNKDGFYLRKSLHLKLVPILT